MVPIKIVSHNKHTQSIYEYIYRLSNQCQLMTPQGDKVNNIPVLIDRQNIANKFNISIRTVIRSLNELVDNNHIYRYEYNRLYIYSINKLNPNQDVLARIKLSP